MPAVKKVAPRKATAAENEVAYPDTLPLYFADGIAATQLGPQHTKITFQSTVPGGRGKARRQPSHTLVIPTAVLLEYMRNLRSMVARAAPQLRASQGQLDKALQNFLAGPAAPTPAAKPKGKIH